MPRSLKEIALDLLDKYFDAQLSVIWEYSTRMGEEEELYEERDRILAEIEAAD